MNITLTINNITKTYDVTVDTKLIDVLREDGLISVKNSCNEGRCGSCTVLMNNIPVPSCIISAYNVREAIITTLESFSTTSDYSDIMTGFSQAGVRMCGFCNSGKIFAAASIINKNARPSKDEILEVVTSLSCKCTETDTLVNGIQLAAAIKRMRIGAKQNADKQ